MRKKNIPEDTHRHGDLKKIALFFDQLQNIYGQSQQDDNKHRLQTQENFLF